jgi:hypothetical protein
MVIHTRAKCSTRQRAARRFARGPGPGERPDTSPTPGYAARCVRLRPSGPGKGVRDFQVNYFES